MAHDAGGAGDESICRMNRSTTPELGLIATWSHRRLARGLEEAEADAALIEALVDDTRWYREVRPT